MADQVRHRTVNVPAGTLKTAPLAVDISYPPADVEAIEIIIPPGHAGLTGIALAHAHQAIIPFDTGEFITSDDEKIHWQLENQPDSGNWQAIVYNEDVFDHVFRLRFLLQVVRHRTVLVGGPEPFIAPATDDTTSSGLPVGGVSEPGGSNSGNGGTIPDIPPLPDTTPDVPPPPEPDVPPEPDTTPPPDTTTEPDAIVHDTPDDTVTPTGPPPVTHPPTTHPAPGTAHVVGPPHFGAGVVGVITHPPVAAPTGQTGYGAGVANLLAGLTPTAAPLWEGHSLHWWQNPAVNKRDGKWRWPGGGGFKHTRRFEGN